jgi:hypothetical protein
MEARLLIAFALMGLVLVLQHSMLSVPAARQAAKTTGASPDTGLAQPVHAEPSGTAFPQSAFSAVADRAQKVRDGIDALVWYWRLLILVGVSALGFYAGVFAIVIWTDDTGWFKKYGFTASVCAIMLCLVFLACLVLAIFLSVQFVGAGLQAAFRIRPGGWAWYWQLLLFAAAAIVGLVTAIAIAAMQDTGTGQWRKTFPLWLTVSICLAICAPIAFRCLKAASGAVVSQIEAVSPSVAAGIALIGALSVNSVDRSAYSRCTTHEWRYVKGGRYKDATNRDVWEHRHGSGTWKKRIHRQRIVWAAVAAAGGFIALANHKPAPELAAIFVNGTACLAAAGLVSITFRR